MWYYADMPQNHKHFILNRYGAGILLFLVIAAVSAVVITKYNHTDAAPSSKSGVGAAVPSQFSFMGTAGWWQGATNKTSMALFHNPHDCFTSIEHKMGIVDAAAELQKTQASLTNDGYMVTPGGVQTLTIQTKTGPQQYELHQSSVATSAGAQPLEGGQEFGYLQLSNGYLKVMGYCDTADELPATLPALQAIKFTD